MESMRRSSGIRFWTALNMPTKLEAREALGLAQNLPVLALFPGSRQQEIDRLIDDFVATAKALQRRRPGLQVIVSVAPTVALDSERCPFRLVHSASLSVLRAADAALCKSGTTTLEAAIADCPLVVAYRTGRVSFALAKRVVKVPHIGLVNVVAGREVAREFIQDDIVPEKMADALVELLGPESPQRREVLSGLAEVRAQARLARSGGARGANGERSRRRARMTGERESLPWRSRGRCSLLGEGLPSRCSREPGAFAS